MDTAQTHNLEKLITLKEASERLNVSIETLLSWNQHNILKPTITQQGEIGYTPSQFNQFLIIREAAQQAHVQPQEFQVLPSLSQPMSEHATDIAFQTIAQQSTKIHGVRRVYSKPLLTISVIVFLMTIALLPKPEGVEPSQYQQTYQKLSDNSQNVLGTNTSRLNISKQIIAALPIQLKATDTSDKGFHNDNSDSIFKEKQTAPALYQQANNDQDASQSVTIAQKPSYDFHGDVNLDDVNAGPYASTGFFQNNQTDDAAAIDNQGKIRGNANSDTLASVVGGIDQMLQNGSLKQGSNDATNQLLLVTLGALAVLFALQKQFAFVNPNKKSFAPQITPLQFSTPLTQKLLEIDQKTDGTVVLLILGKEYKISKPEMNSESDQFIEKLMQLAQNNVQEIEYDSLLTDKNRFITPLSRLVTRLGFVGIKRDLFFPRTSKNSVLFRRYLTQEDLDAMNLTVNHVLNELELLS